VELFIERALAVVPGFALHNDADIVAVTEICRRLDGIALAIELAAARMVSMTPGEVLARLNDRFRLLSGSRRGLERHQTLRQAVQWSYDLLTPDEQSVLGACAVFAGGFDAVSVTAVCEQFDEYTMLDLLDSLVRKSLITATQVGGRTRYGMLETIRQFTEDQHANGGGLAELRDRHARYHADKVMAQWDLWDGPGYDDATEWVEVEFDNLRAGFRWATDQADLTIAVAIAAHTTTIAFQVEQYEPVGWAEELLPAASSAELAQLPRLYTAASYCTFIGRADDAVGYAQAAVRLQDDPGYQPFTSGLAAYQEAMAHLWVGRIDWCLEICTGLGAQTGVARLLGLGGLTMLLPLVGRSGEAIAIAPDTMNAARASANPSWIAFAYYGCGRAYTVTEPERALDFYREGLGYNRQHRLAFWDAFIARDAAALEAAHGDIDHALDLFDTSIDSFHQSGDSSGLAWLFANLMVFFDRNGRPDIAATLHGCTGSHPVAIQAPGFDAAVDHVRNVLDTDTFEHCVRAGAAMTVTEAVRYAHQHIQLTRQHQP
jgi:tetratricopeptide (TPR) repeat protein